MSNQLFNNDPFDFHPFYAEKEIFEISVCKNVPKEFDKYILDKRLCYFPKHNYCMPNIGKYSFENRGKVSQSFIDEVSSQVEVTDKVVYISFNDFTVNSDETKCVFTNDGKIKKYVQ